MKMKIRFYLLTILIITFNLGYSQLNTVNTYNSIPLNTNVDFDDTEKNYVFWHAATLLRGNFVLGFERSFLKKHAVSFAFGLTLQDVFFESNNNKKFEQINIKSTDNNNSNNTGNNGNGGTNTNLSQANINYNSGYFVEIGYKFYPKSTKTFEGFYMGPTLAFRNYKGISTLIVTKQLRTPEREEEWEIGYSIIDPAVKIGYMFNNIIIEGLTLDIYGGFGTRNGFLKGTITKYNLPDGDPDRIITGFERKTLTVSYPAAHLGFKAGFTF